MRPQRRKRKPRSAPRSPLELTPVHVQPRQPASIRIGISACLLGEEVRFDGGHKRDRFLVDILGPYVQWVPVCPEVEVGMGTPREPVNLVRSGKELRMITARTGVDYTDAMVQWARTRVRELAVRDLCGYVLKKNSPSCGLEAVKVYSRPGGATRTGRGLFARVLVEEMPWLPVEEEDRLARPELRDNFLERIQALRRLHDMFAAGFTIDRLVRFHTAHKMMLLAHSRAAYDALGRLVANAAALSRRELRDTYRLQFMDALAIVPTPARHVDALLHMAGHFKGRLGGEATEDLRRSIDLYRQGRLPRSVPLNLVRSHAEKLGIPYLSVQTYLAPPLLETHYVPLRPDFDAGN